MKAKVQFKIDDIVRCVWPDGNWLQRDKLYTVVYILESRLGDLIQVSGVSGILWSTKRFEK